MNMDIFEIKNLNCAYKEYGRERSRIVLHIKELNIPAGKLVFIIGSSGIGKSTILETLGLMNNTLDGKPNNSIFKYHHPKTNETYDLIEIIERDNDQELSAFRRSNFSFIFQQTNLMHNFSTYQNVMITSMLQGETEKKSKSKTKEIFEVIGITEEDVSGVPTKLAGGQQQRLAYARAILPDFNVLFGDEPTGNLDFGNANILINDIKTQIKEKKATAIIVSHDLNLAIEFADLILLIQPVKDEEGKIIMGYVDALSAFQNIGNGQWLNDKKTYRNNQDLHIFLKERISNKRFIPSPIIIAKN